MTSIAEPLVRTQPAQFEATVVAVTDLGAGMVRVTCAAEGLRTFVPCGPDEYVGLLMPPAGHHPLVMPDPEPVDVRACVAALPEAERPALRWYTIRDHDPVLGHIDLDIVTHGDSGPGSAWTCRARPGDPVGIRAGGALYRGGGVRGRQVLVADETAVPSVAAILDAGGGAGDARDHGVEVHVEVSDPAVLAAYDLGDVSVHRRAGRPGSTVVPALQVALAAAGGPVAYAWVCGEAGLVAGARRALRRHGTDRRSIFACGYWKLGRARP
ncbi:MAG: siderophore-interacting protein [Ornithinibacter sp.]